MQPDLVYQPLEAMPLLGCAAHPLWRARCGAVLTLVHSLDLSPAGEQGLLTVTDDDVIEKSNLSRQFLFRWALPKLPSLGLLSVK